jgi:S1-C subfamily serine protease
MNSGRSSSEPRPRPDAPHPRILIAAAALLALAGGMRLTAATQPKPLPPPEDDVGPAPKPSPPARGAAPAQPGPQARPAPPAARAPVCPRCGYRCDAAWNFCVACGWDLATLIDAAEEEQLQTIAGATVGVTVGGKRNRYSTAFPYAETGYYLTNARVLIGADSELLRVRTYKNREYKASIVGYDLPTGFGVIKVDQPDAPRIKAAPAPPAPPDAAWAVCYLIVLEGDVVRYLPVSLHRGRLTATGQAGTEFVSFENLLRTDHAIEDGCTGGPLVDSRGRIAGMILGGPEDGITFVAPLDVVPELLVHLAEGKAPPRPYFGIGLVMSDERRRVKFGLDGQTARPMIAYVIPDSPAAKAGVRAGDLLLAVGGEPIATIPAAGARLLAAKPGGPGPALTLQRAGRDQEIVLTVDPRPGRVLLEPVDELEEALQVNIKEVVDGPAAQRGLVIADVVRGGRGEKSLYRNGDAILEVDGKAVKNIQQFNTTVRGIFEKHFGNNNPGFERRLSSYVVELGIRTASGKRVTRNYINLFPDILAPPVY